MINVDYGYEALGSLNDEASLLSEDKTHTLQKIRNVQAPQNFNILEENIYIFFCELAFC